MVDLTEINKQMKIVEMTPLSARNDIDKYVDQSLENLHSASRIEEKQIVNIISEAIELDQSKDHHQYFFTNANQENSNERPYENLEGKIEASPIKEPPKINSARSENNTLIKVEKSEHGGGSIKETYNQSQN